MLPGLFTEKRNDIHIEVTDFAGGISEDVNSDFISNKMNENGTITDVAISNVIRITSSSYANIDLGLIFTKKFDLKLNKYVTKVNKQLAKLPDKIVNSLKENHWTVSVTDKNLAKTYFDGVYSMSNTGYVFHADGSLDIISAQECDISKKTVTFAGSVYDWETKDDSIVLSTNGTEVMTLVP